MKIKALVNVSVMGKESNKIESSGKESFKLAILQGAEAGSISCTDTVYNSVKPFHSYTLEGTYDDKYNYMRITGVVPNSEKSMSMK